MTMLVISKRISVAGPTCGITATGRVCDEDGSWYVLGRSDDTIKVAGKRVGPSEVESVLTSHDSVSEAATIGAPDDLKGQVLVCFVVLKPGGKRVEDNTLHLELIAHVAKEMGKPLAPKAVHVVPALPKTRSGKILRGMILRVFSGQPAGDLTSVENPSALEAIVAIRDTVNLFRRLESH